MRGNLLVSAAHWVRIMFTVTARPVIQKGGVLFTSWPRIRATRPWAWPVCWSTGGTAMLVSDSCQSKWNRGGEEEPPLTFVEGFTAAYDPGPVVFISLFKTVLQPKPHPHPHSGLWRGLRTNPTLASHWPFSCLNVPLANSKAFEILNN